MVAYARSRRVDRRAVRPFRPFHPPSYDRHVRAQSQPEHASRRVVVDALFPLFPLGPIFDGAALNVTVISDPDKVCIGFLTCPEVCPLVEHLADASAPGGR
jgi:hypothetical protein